MNDSIDSRLNELDMLRGLALIGVITVHTVLFFPSGFLMLDNILVLGRFGVQLFFVISGFTMALVSSRVKIIDKKFIVNFYLKRFLRIIPLLFIASLLYIPVHLSPSYWNPLGFDFSNYIILYTMLSGFFPENINNVVPGSWSIINELYFYIIFPALLYLINRYSVYTIYLIMILLMFFSSPLEFIIRELYSSSDNNLLDDFIYLNFLNQLPCFLLGVLAFYLYELKLSSLRRHGLILSSISLMYFIYWIAFGGGFLTYIISLSAFAMLMITLSFKLPYPKVLSQIGKVTYTGYIIHFGIIYLFDWVLYSSQGGFFIVILPILSLVFYASKILKPYTEDFFLLQNIRRFNMRHV
ncbi:acyltransferase family protein [Photobacterium kagoshimensis]|uniref:acyltransferase family protein n=1 Tax=Photobacterium kagoshimensis TaxID=2910242 RepID=UPI003D0BEAD6